MSRPVHIRKAGAGRNRGLVAGLALSLLTGRPAVFHDLKDDNPNPEPGLGPGGLALVRAACLVSGGRYEGAPGMDTLEFHPGALAGGDYTLDMASRQASPAPLSFFLEALGPALARLPEGANLMLMGGTHVPQGMTSEEVKNILLPNWRRAGINAHYSEIAPGFLPKGKGEAEAGLGPCPCFQAVQAEKPFTPMEIGVEVLCSGLPLHLAEQASNAAQDRLELHGLKPRIRIRRARGAIGMSLLVWARGAELNVGYKVLGHRGGQPSGLGIQAAEALHAFLGSAAGLNSDSAAFLAPALACAPAISRFTVDRVFSGLKSALAAVEAFHPGTVRIDQPRPAEPAQVRIMGLERG